ncbi:hypothetical protein E1301_Tti000634 [Triplophysa tibetana]|uniref:DDE Tnp4 domain-containing protein n=1 Tax=Triplophysa tibetana TaxID=1572043 RepID=A0A5A9N3Z4_9TELE|nr:hypothetical protein E1301_Tti000634 [Triplophysa tibetana]
MFDDFAHPHQQKPIGCCQRHSRSYGDAMGEERGVTFTNHQPIKVLVGCIVRLRLWDHWASWQSCMTSPFNSASLRPNDPRGGSVSQAHVNVHLSSFEEHATNPPRVDFELWCAIPVTRRIPYNQSDERYNNALTHTRSIIERTIGQLKRRFHCLPSELRVKPQRACKIIVACVVLFNISKMYSAIEEENEPEEEQGPEEVQPIHEDFQQAGYAARDAIVYAFFNL